VGLCGLLNWRFGSRILGAVAIYRTAVDIFPVVDIPVISVIWIYSGMAPEEMTGRITTVSERAITTTVSDIEHIESQSYTGVSVIKIYFHTGANIPEAVAEVTAVMQGVLRVLPPGITPPFIIQYSASDVPILQAAVYSDTLSEDQLNDYSNQFIRTQLATVQGASVPLAYGGAPRNLMVDLDPERMFAKNVSAADVSNAFNAQSLILPSGDAKMGVRDYNVRINNSPTVVEQLNDLPIKQVNGVVVYLRKAAALRPSTS
jgi:multidrug efflux pump subunit AcrB